MTYCRTIEEVIAAAVEESKGVPPISQETADLLAAIKVRYLRHDTGADEVPDSAAAA